VLERIRNSCLSFFKKNFNTNSLIVAIFFSLPIYFNFLLIKYNIELTLFFKILFTINLFLAFFYLFHSNHKWFGSGFLIGLFWFWWIGLSFRYYDLSWMIPIVILIVAFIYGVIFYVIGKICELLEDEAVKKFFLVLVFTFGFDYISLFTFDWLKSEVLFINSIFEVEKIVLFLVIYAIAFYKKLKYISFLLLIIAIFIKSSSIKEPKLDIYVASTNIDQDKKWDKRFLSKQIDNNFNIIDKAIKLKKDVVILPESAFPMFLNLYPELIDKLKNLSKKIVIITGALHLKDNKFYNSTYIFQNTKLTILDKHKLVPFGEYIPIAFFQKEINEFFFNGASDYEVSKNFGIFNIKGYDFINAICYEVTLKELYKLKPNYIVALSNVAWFMPSIMPSLQQMIIKIYAKKYKKNVYHSINGFKSYIVKN